MTKEDLKDNLRELAGPILFLCGISGIIILLITIQNSLSKISTPVEEFTYVSKIILPNTLPVIKTENSVIGMPYTGDKIKVARSFYDYLKNSEEQSNALIYYDNTYIQNSGIDYSEKEIFDVISVLDGTVINVTEDQMLGNIVEIKHSNELISVYQSLSEIEVKKDQTVTKGQVIGKSGTNNISANLDNHLHFELYYKGQVVNPIEYYNKTLTELQ